MPKTNYPQRKIHAILHAVCVPMFLVASLATVVESCRADAPAERAAKKLSWEIESRRAIEVRVRTEISADGAVRQSAPRGRFDVFVEHYIETAAGNRFNEFHAYDGDKLQSHHEDYGDGTRYAHVGFSKDDPEEQNTVAIMRQYWREDEVERKQVPQPLLSLYVGREPLHKALARAESLGECKVLGRVCDSFLFRGVKSTPKPQDKIYSLDRETGTPLKVEAYSDQAARERGEPLWMWTADSFDRADKYPLIAKSTIVTFQKEAPKTPQITWRSHVESVEFDKTYPSAMFWPAIQPSATVFDSFTQKVTPGKNARKLDNKLTSVVPVVDASPPTAWTAYGPRVLLISGFLVLVASVIVWWKKR